MTKLERVRLQLHQGFPELEKVELEIRYAMMGSNYLTIHETYEGEFCIEVDFSLRIAPLEVLLGGMSHEFGHMTLDLRKSPNKRDEAMKKYHSSQRYRKYDERRADKLAVERGYGLPLLAFKQFAEKRGEPSEICLTLAEINKILGRAS